VAEYTVKEFHPLRRATIGVLEAASHKHMIHALLEVDVSKARSLISQYKAETGNSLSFTAYLIHCLARVVARNRHMQACRDWRNRLILFDDVDVSTTVERELNGTRQVVPFIVRAANGKSVLEIHSEIRGTQSDTPSEAGVYPLMRLFVALPVFLQSIIFRVMNRFPQIMKKNVGTVMLTSVGMFGSGGGWGIPVATHTLNVTVGGIMHRPVCCGDSLHEKEHLCITASFDHDIIDGAPAARFLDRFAAIISEADALQQLVSSPVAEILSPE
jgi:pyruvate/2-oxoglutarate dehydrogenase complex dihydrolipoamide acyltransferase (E2) component